MEQQRKSSQGRVKWLVIALLAIHSGLLAYGAYVHSPTLNEPAHLVAGISYWQQQRFDLYSVNPPLVRLVAAAPVILAGCETDWSSFQKNPGARPEMAMGSDFCSANGFRVCWLTTLARWACIPFSLVGGYVCFRWARELYGTAAGMLSLTVWCFCPNILAHGQLISSDVAATSLGVAACFTFWRWLKSPTWWNTFVSGLVLGVAELTKTTLIIFYPVWPLLWIVYRWPDRKNLISSDWFNEFGKLCVRMVITLYVINLGYLFEGSFTKLGEFVFVSNALTGRTEIDTNAVGNRFTSTWLGSVPVPLPKNYLIGMDLQQRDFEHYSHEFYLGGKWSKTGWWYYYLYALAIKVPLGIWLLICLAFAARMFTKPSAQFRDELFLLTPAIVILTFVSSQTGINEHLRYVLPIFPFIYIWLGRIAQPIERSLSSLTKGHYTRNSYPAVISIIALTWSIGSSIYCYPHSLSYFNELVGGPRGGANHLLHSNIDWGQDLLFLKEWIEKHPDAGHVNVAFFGPFDPKYLGGCFGPNEMAKEDVSAASVGLTPGWYAISVNLVHGLMTQHAHLIGEVPHMQEDKFKLFGTIQPSAMAGYSIGIYHIPTPNAR